VRLLIAFVGAPLLAILALAGAAILVLQTASETDPPPTPAATRPSVAPPSPAAAGNVCQGVVSLPDPGQPRRFAPEYTQITEHAGIAIVANDRVSPRAIEEARHTVERFFANNDFDQPLAAEGAYVIVAASGQGVLDLPEFRCLDEEAARDFFDHVCGVADRADYPVVTVNEDDLLGRRSGPCGGLNILYHELAHLVMGWVLPPADYFDVRQFYQDAVSAGKYRGDYAATNANEYFAEGTQAYFLHSDLAGRRDRDWLRDYDPNLFDLLARTYGE
jgi:alpha-glucosidase